eukprot:TRINITY_DN11977_c0_g5_i1.p1 TRINITY_DN11977_c0_g5~~TRINITY_DN11977_c0_g5_i1.p1  ORF type:complete len:468 (-),score=145.36 TRINITY_DN11977_c0_g5_i1:994-2397(-)
MPEDDARGISGHGVELQNAGESRGVRLAASKMDKHPMTDDDDDFDIARFSMSGKRSSELPMGIYLKRSFKEIFFGTRLNILMPLIPLTMVASWLKFSHGWIFGLSLLGMAPLAERLGFVTEQISIFTGSTVGGLLNATFGNATELIICIFALKSGLVRVVQLSLLGSILSNMLLVLGCSFFFGGLKHSEQKFNKTAALVSSGLLLMTVMGLVLPAVLQATHTELHTASSELVLSRVTACIMLVAYISYLYFQLFSHSHLYDDPVTAAAVVDSLDGPDGTDSVEGKEGEAEEVDDEEEDFLGFKGALVWLGVITVVISILSEYLVDAIEGAAVAWGLPVSFISVIILPIVGNATEHASAVVVATKNKLDISLGIAIGSSTQIAMFVIPFSVVLAWIMGVKLDLNFRIFETATLFVTVMVVAVLLLEGKANYFKGIMLVLSYCIVAASFFVHTDNDLELGGAAPVGKTP